MESGIGAIVGIAAGLAIGLVLLALVTIIFKWLWNTTLPDVLEVKQVDFWQAFKILIISAMIFGGGTTVIQQGSAVMPADQDIVESP